jgi:uncharacterized membrane protein YoaT (DUF817 family)
VPSQPIVQVTAPGLAAIDAEPRPSFLRWTLSLFLHFAWNELLCCVFPLGVFFTLWLTRIVHVPGVPRYDLILLICLAMQWAMVRFGLETKDELKVICVFHVIGLAMELYKTSIGSWAYPEAAYTKLGAVPLYSGFMYASVASYMCQGWRRFDLRLTRMPPNWLMVALAAAVYVNFFTNHFLIDVRWLLGAAVFAVFWPTRVHFSVADSRLRMPMALAFVLIGFFVWVAENIGTYLGGWQYPHQADGWDFVQVQKISSWSLLVIVSFVLVAWLKNLKARPAEITPAP